MLSQNTWMSFTTTTTNLSLPICFASYLLCFLCSAFYHKTLPLTTLFLLLGELSRVYSKEDTVRHLSNIQICGMIFHAIAPLSPVLFGWIEFDYFVLQINKYNSVGLVLILSTVVYQVMAYFLLADLTKEPGYEIFVKLEGKQDEFLSNTEEDNRKINDNDQKTKEVKKLISAREILTNTDIILILVGVFVMEFMDAQFEISINLVAITKFAWSIERLSAITIVGFLISIGVMWILKRFNTPTDTRYLFIFLLVVDGFLVTALILPITFDVFKTRYIQVTFMLFIMVFKLTVAYCIQVFSSCLLFVTIPSHSWCFIIGVRRVFFTSAGGLGFFTATTLFNGGSTAYPVLSILCIGLVFVLLLNTPNYLKRYCKDRT